MPYGNSIMIIWDDRTFGSPPGRGGEGVIMAAYFSVCISDGVSEPSISMCCLPPTESTFYHLCVVTQSLPPPSRPASPRCTPRSSLQAAQACCAGCCLPCRLPWPTQTRR